MSEGGDCGDEASFFGVSQHVEVSLQYSLEMFSGDRMVGEVVDLQTKWLAIVDSMLSRPCGDGLVHQFICAVPG